MTRDYEKQTGSHSAVPSASTPQKETRDTANNPVDNVRKDSKVSKYKPKLQQSNLEA